MGRLGGAGWALTGTGDDALKPVVEVGTLGRAGRTLTSRGGEGVLASTVTCSAVLASRPVSPEAISTVLASRPISPKAISTVRVSALTSWAVSPAAETEAAGTLTSTGAGELRCARWRELRLGSADADAPLVLEREAFDVLRGCGRPNAAPALYGTSMQRSSLFLAMFFSRSNSYSLSVLRSRML
jgi:hypothetical protein